MTRRSEQGRRARCNALDKKIGDETRKKTLKFTNSTQNTCIDAHLRDTPIPTKISHSETPSPPLPTCHELNQAFADAQARGALARVRGPPTCTSTSCKSTTCKSTRETTCKTICAHVRPNVSVQTSRVDIHTYRHTKKVTPTKCTVK